MKYLKHLVIFACMALFMCHGSVISAYAYDFTGFEMIAESSKLKLYFNEEDVTFIAEDKDTGALWSSFIREDQANINRLNAKWKNDLKSPYLLNYTSKKETGGATLQLNVGGGAPELVKERIPNGVRVTSTFTIIEPLPLNAKPDTPPNPPSYITFAFEVTLDGDAVVAHIPFSSIIEEGMQSIVSIEFFPSFGAAMDGDEGYIFYPEGSGAIMEFQDLNHFRESRRTWNVYGSDVAYLVSRAHNSKFETVMLPVFGSKVSDNAFLGIIEEGQQTSKINLTPSTNIVRLNRISCEFVYRRFFDDPRVTTKPIKMYDKQIIEQDYTVRYTVLEKEMADYSGMANKYREYLLANNLMEKVIKENDNIPLGVDIFMGINERVMFFDNYITMTKFDQAQMILDTIRSMGVADIQTQLNGWMKNGYETEPEHFPASSKLGGDSKLKELAQYANNNGIMLFLQSNINRGYDGRSGYSKRNDVAYYGNERIVSRNDMFILNPKFILEYFKDTFIKKAQSFPNVGISYETLGEIVYYDYNVKRYTTKAETLDIWTEILRTTKETQGSVATYGGNQYVLSYSDRLSGIPEDSREYFLSTDSVPFYQMVVHGYIPYSGNAGNLSHDLNKQKLKWIELGYMPYFELTYESSEKLNYTSYNALYTSKYDEWADTAADMYKEFNDNIKGVWAADMIKHEKVMKDVYKVTYSNGTAIYVNYSSRDAAVDGHTVHAQDYLVVTRPK